MIRDYELITSRKNPYCMFKVGALQRFTLLDFPGKVACIVFTQGCNFRCPYCYNVDLVLPERFKEPISNDEVFSFLRSREGLLDGVVITGGEPTLQEGLENFIREVKNMGFSVKLDTNGSRPEVIKRLLDDGFVNYVAMDVKAPIEKYGEVTRAKVNVEDIKESIAIIMNSCVDYEFRTTIVKELLTFDDILKIGNMIKGARRYYLQRFIPQNTLDPDFEKGRHLYR